MTDQVNVFVVPEHLNETGSAFVSGTHDSTHECGPFDLRLDQQALSGFESQTDLECDLSELLEHLLLRLVHVLSPVLDCVLCLICQQSVVMIRVNGSL
jgi:hypothetical protein